MTRQGQVLAGRYELGTLRGVGGMASVYRATDRVLARTVAVKVLGPPYDQHPVLVERFRSEARAAAALNHPNIVAVYDSGSEAGVHYIVMEYVPGQTLADILRRQGVLDPGRAAEVGCLVCQALAAAHARGLVHRDVKPANVLVSQDGQVKVADFGIAKAATPTLTGSGPLLGTAAYLSPEQAQGGPVDARSDVHALGCVLYELLTGTLPFVADSPVAVASRQVIEAPIPPSRRNPQVGPELEAVVMAALTKEPARRYQTASAMGQELARIVGGDAAGAAPPPVVAGPATEALGRLRPPRARPRRWYLPRGRPAAPRVDRLGHGGRCWQGWAWSCCWSGGCGGCAAAMPHRCGAGGTGSHDRVYNRHAHDRVHTRDHQLVDADHHADDPGPGQPVGGAGQAE